MDAIDLRPCPFCANHKLTTVYASGGRVVIVKCDECGATGPVATGTDPSGHAEFLWNQRYGTKTEH